MENYRKELEHFLRNKFYIIFLIFISAISYGYAAVNTTISIDDTRADFYVGSGNIMIASGRFGMTLWSRIFGYQNELIYHSFAIDIISIFLLLWAATNFCILFRRIAKDKISMLSFTIFSCILISYPLMNEIWEYTAANLCVCIGYLCVSIILLLLWEQIHHVWHKGKICICLILLTLVCATYESLLIVYIFMVFAILTMQSLYYENKDSKIPDFIRQGCFYAAILAGSFIMRLIIHQLLLFILQLPKADMGATYIAWEGNDILHHAGRLISSLGFQYFLKGIIYMPFTELDISIIIFFILGIYLTIQHKNYGLLLFGSGMFLSLFLLSFIQGCFTPYRACQVFAVFVAFTLMLLTTVLEHRKKKLSKFLFNFVIFCCLMLCLRQAICLNYFLTVNHMRSEEEIDVVKNISSELRQNHNLNKPVIFTGTYTLSDKVTEAASISLNSFQWNLYSQIYSIVKSADFNEVYYQYDRKLPDTNVSSVLQWASTTANDAYYDLFQYYGVDCLKPDDSILSKATDYSKANDLPGYPREGYIRETKEYIIINFE